MTHWVVEQVGLEPGSRVVVAMSGGVDSSVTAAVLAEAGYDVIGVTLQLYDHGAAIERKGACCAGQDIYDARQVADTIGFPHYVLDYESRFSQSVMDDFADSYLAGETPIPCVRCNQRVKFRDLLETARDLGAEALATGHYARRDMGPDGRARLLRAVDPTKDQSYFLFATTQEQLDYLRFPLGGLTKDETRELADRYALPVATKPDSQDICFVPNGKYADVVAKLRPGAIDPGEIVHVDGTVLGRHDGIINYTIGQRKGLGIGGRPGDEGPLYVVGIDAPNRRVLVGPKIALAKSSLEMKECNWISGIAETSESFTGTAKIRNTTAPVPVTVTPSASGRARVTFADPEFGVSPGQACVIYSAEADGAGSDQVLGGGWIAAA